MAKEGTKGPRRAAFLDRDGTLIEDPGYLGDPSEVVLLPGAAQAVALLCQTGHVVVVVSNQSGVARGLYDDDAVHAVNRRVAALLLAADPRARLGAFYHCPHLDEQGRPPCACRKPRPGLFLRAAKELSLDLATSIAIGDADRDIAAARAAGCGSVLRILSETRDRAEGPRNLLQAVWQLLPDARRQGPMREGE